jgi:hypothetical protein
LQPIKGISDDDGIIEMEPFAFQKVNVMEMIQHVLAGM